MQYPEQYRAELLSVLKNIDLSTVDKVVEIFREVRARGRCIFVCGGGSNAVAPSRLLCDMLRSSNINRTLKFRIFALTDEMSVVSSVAGDVRDHVLVNELRNVASPGDVVLGINASGNSRSVQQAFEYAHEIGCRTICISGWGGGKLATISDAAILVPASYAGNVEDAQNIICRMIGNYFANFDQD